jgi:hypothetical protein
MKNGQREVRNLILLLSSATCIAFIAVVALVYYFGSSGTYLLRTILVAPEALEKISFTDYDPTSKRQIEYVFDKIEFVRTGKEGQKHFSVTPQAYAHFYKLLYSERSIPTVTEHMVRAFNLTTPSALLILAKPRDPKLFSAGSILFQQVQFIEGAELFRVQLRTLQGAPLEEWAYFRYPGISEDVVALFALRKP